MAQVERQKERTRSRRETFFATCAPGLEPVLHREAADLRLAKVERQVGGVRFEGTIEDAWRANLWLRTAVRVLLRVARFRAVDETELYRGVREIDWSRFIRADRDIAVSAQTRDSKLRHSLYIAQRTKDAIADQFVEREGARPSVDRTSADVWIHVHLFRDRATVSIDTSGESLHKRGWRRFQGRAPLAETLAAGIVLLSGWDRRAPLLDPFCGSGTILIEAALIASNTPPGIFREEFAFERLPGHDPRAWSAARERAREGASWPPRLILRGADIDPEAIAGARENVRAAGLEGRIDLRIGTPSEMELKRNWNAWIVTNPPYGERVGAPGGLASLYRRFGKLLRERCGGYQAAILAGNRELGRSLGLSIRGGLRLRNGPLECELLRGEVPR